MTRIRSITKVSYEVVDLGECYPLYRRWSSDDWEIDWSDIAKIYEWYKIVDVRLVEELERAYQEYKK